MEPPRRETLLIERAPFAAQWLFFQAGFQALEVAIGVLDLPLGQESSGLHDVLLRAALQIFCELAPLAILYAHLIPQSQWEKLIILSFLF